MYISSDLFMFFGTTKHGNGNFLVELKLWHFWKGKYFFDKWFGIFVQQNSVLNSKFFQGRFEKLCTCTVFLAWGSRGMPNGIIGLNLRINNQLQIITIISMPLNKSLETISKTLNSQQYSGNDWKANQTFYLQLNFGL